MNGPEHYCEAERLLSQARDVDADGNHYFLADSECDVAAAQVHATLALAAATALPAVEKYLGNERALWDEQREWTTVTAPAPKPLLVKCPACDGQGVVSAGYDAGSGRYDSTDCAVCGGDGECTSDVAERFEDDRHAAEVGAL